jgi:hypothetical protein
VLRFQAMTAGKLNFIPRVALSAFLALVLSLGLLVEGARSETYEADALTINVDRGSREIFGTLVADSLYWYLCWGDGDAHVKIRRLQPGRDKLVTEDQYTDLENNWMVRLRSTAVKGKRIYAEVPGFNNCAAVRSRVITAP